MNTVIDELYEDSGAIEVAAMSVEVSEEFVETLYVSKQLTSPDVLSKTIIVLVLYSSMWSLGLMTMGFLFVHDHLSSRKRVVVDTLRTLKLDAATKGATAQETVQKYLVEYVDSVFPNVYNHTPWYDRLIAEVRKHHRYLFVFSGSAPAKEKFVTVMHLLTVQTMLMFMLAVFYDLQVV